MADMLAVSLALSFSSCLKRVGRSAAEPDMFDKADLISAGIIVERPAALACFSDSLVIDVAITSI